MTYKEFFKRWLIFMAIVFPACLIIVAGITIPTWLAFILMASALWLGWRYIWKKARKEDKG